MIADITTLLTAQVTAISSAVVAVLTVVLPVAVAMLLFTALVGEKSKGQFINRYASTCSWVGIASL